MYAGAYSAFKVALEAQSHAIVVDARQQLDVILLRHYLLAWHDRLVVRQRHQAAGSLAHRHWRARVLGQCLRQWRERARAKLRENEQWRLAVDVHGKHLLAKIIRRWRSKALDSLILKRQSRLPRWYCVSRPHFFRCAAISTRPLLLFLPSVTAVLVCIQSCVHHDLG